MSLRQTGQIGRQKKKTNRDQESSIIHDWLHLVGVGRARDPGTGPEVSGPVPGHLSADVTADVIGRSPRPAGSSPVLIGRDGFLVSLVLWDRGSGSQDAPKHKLTLLPRSFFLKRCKMSYREERGRREEGRRVR